MAARVDAKSDMNVQDEIQRLRDQVQSLIADRAAPYLADVAGRAEDAVRHSYDSARENLDSVAERVRGQPIGAVLIAAAAGFLLGRFTR